MTGRVLWLALGWAATACAIVGIALPLIPTTPFLLVAAYAFARSSPRLHHWLTTHKQFGPLIDDWHRYGAINRRAKITAVFVMAASLALSWFFGVGTVVLALQAVVLVGAALFILSRPDGPSAN
jgi:hypothetical protein